MIYKWSALIFIDKKYCCGHILADTKRQFFHFLERYLKFVEADLFPLFWQLVLHQENMIPAFSCNLKHNGHRGETTLL